MIKVFSRPSMVAFYEQFPKNTTPVISISDIGYGSPVPEDHPCALRLYFDDITPFLVSNDLAHPYYKEIQKHRDLVYFDDTMAKKVYDFIKACKCDDLYLHCYAGVSRSASIALFARFLCPHLGEVIGVQWDDTRMNPYVYGKLMKIFFNNGEEDVKI